jgi:bis(5'-nucleosyl)-tetraphosphatase (symmetrical)
MWAIGDLQGCGTPLERLLAALPPADSLIFVGDLVNRGDRSLETLRRVRDLCESGRAQALLGNQDLHLLAVDAGIRPEHDDDTLAPILAAPDRAELLTWMRHRPLAIAAAGALFVHAGVLPPWTRELTLQLAAEIEIQLRSAEHKTFLATMYGNEPSRWSDLLRGADRWRCVINALTRVRFVAADGAMDLLTKDGMKAMPEGHTPWFDHPARATRDTPIVFGHWSTLGLMLRDDVMCLDSGCVWGGKLTAMHWPSRRLVEVNCSRDNLQE